MDFVDSKRGSPNDGDLRGPANYLVVVVVVEPDGVIMVEDGEVVVVVDVEAGGVTLIVVSPDFAGSEGIGTATTVVDGAGVLTTGGGLFTTVGFSQALMARTASDAVNNTEYFIIFSCYKKSAHGTRASLMRLRVADFLISLRPAPSQAID